MRTLAGSRVGVGLGDRPYDLDVPELFHTCWHIPYEEKHCVGQCDKY